MRTELTTYTREQLEEMAKSYAKMQLIGDIYYGRIGEQNIEWQPDGSIRVITNHEPEQR